MAWASFANLIPKLPDFFGLGVDYAVGSLGGMPDSKARKNQIHDIRTLRRRQYQDMVHSLTEAGLNPILATGASPGHASATMLPPNLGTGGGGSAGVGSALAANKQADTAAGKAPSEIAKNAAGTGLLQDQAINTQLGRAGLIQNWDRVAADIDATRQTTRTNAALAEKYKQDAITGGANAKEIEAKIHALETYGPSGTSWAGMLRALLGAPQDQSNAKDVGNAINPKNFRDEFNRLAHPPSLPKGMVE